MLNTFYFENGQENVYNDRGQKAFNLVKDILAQIKDPNIIPETVTGRQDQLMTEENVSSRITDTRNNVLAENLYSFCSHSKVKTNQHNVGLITPLLSKNHELYKYIN
ncbi:hypothetical protein INT46_008218 [Mucor plumbeus]|uniref:Uncharacterized protein n=1 Tax=Mucor plumbeus TaxID=97098 RepID=A0A8H7QDY8_9FUNG|nr:hypothetical protein INT46_008218 [Mucor plumbeus]